MFYKRIFLCDNRKLYYLDRIRQFKQASLPQHVPRVIIDIPIESHGWDCIIKVLARVA